MNANLVGAFDRLRSERLRHVRESVKRKSRLGRRPSRSTAREDFALLQAAGPMIGQRSRAEGMTTRHRRRDEHAAPLGAEEVSVAEPTRRPFRAARISAVVALVLVLSSLTTHVRGDDRVVELHFHRGRWAVRVPVNEGEDARTTSSHGVDPFDFHRFVEIGAFPGMSLDAVAREVALVECPLRPISFASRRTRSGREYAEVVCGAHPVHGASVLRLLRHDDGNVLVSRERQGWDSSDLDRLVPTYGATVTTRRDRMDLDLCGGRLVLPLGRDGRAVRVDPSSTWTFVLKQGGRLAAGRVRLEPAHPETSGGRTVLAEGARVAWARFAGSSVVLAAEPPGIDATAVDARAAIDIECSGRSDSPLWLEIAFEANGASDGLADVTLVRRMLSAAHWERRPSAMTIRSAIDVSEVPATRPRFRRVDVWSTVTVILALAAIAFGLRWERDSHRW